MDRTYHNLFNQIVNGFSGNDLHAYMDRFAKSLRQEHRGKGHDVTALTEMLVIFSKKYTPTQIFNTWLLHKAVDNWDTGFKDVVKSSNRNYGKKAPILKVIENLKKEVLQKS